MCEELQCERTHRRAVKERRLAQLFIGERCLQWPTLTNDRDVGFGGAGGDFEHRLGNVILERCGRTERHARYVHHDVALADN